MSKLFINCRKATYLHEQKKEGKLGFAESIGLWLHLLYCGICKRFVSQVEEVEKACKKPLYLANVQTSEAFREKLNKCLEIERKTFN